jgi:aminopeptidase N
MKTDTPPTVYLKDYEPPRYLIDKVDLDFALHPTRTRVKSRLAMRPNPLSRKAGLQLVLDGESLELLSIALDGKALAKEAYALSDSRLTLASPPQQPFSLEIETVCNPEANTTLSGLYLSRGVYCTQCEAEGFRRITYYLDRPDVMAVYRVRIEADREAHPVLLSNGNPTARGALKGGRHFAVWDDPHKKPSYLFALVAGNLASVRSNFTTASGRRVDLGIYVEPGKEDRCEWAMQSLKRSMRWDEERFGREYDLDVFNIVAVSDFNMGAMENKGLNVFNDRLVLATAETATDASYEAIEAVIAHEYFHNWTGNRITCRDWFQLCLKEGLTVFRDQEFTADVRQPTVQRITSARDLKATQFPEDAGPLAHPVRPSKYIEINNFYTATVYEKGAELCRMIMTIVGREGFRKGMDLYFERHDGDAATVEDFVRCFEDANKIDLSQFMTWYSQAGTPELVCALKYDRRKKTAELTVTQVLPPTPGEPKKKPLHIPLRVGLLGGNGEDLELTLEGGERIEDGLLHVHKRTETFRFKDVPSRPVPSLLRGFSAPVRLTVDLSDEDLAFLMANDSDLYNRWQAGQDYATRVMLRGVKALRKGQEPESGESFAKALGATIANDGLDPAYRAEALDLPSESDLARELGRDVDPEAIHEARRRFRRSVGSVLGPVLEDIYLRYESKGSYSPDAASVGKRALRNTALAVLAMRGKKADFARVAQQYWEATNNTDETMALAILTHLRVPERGKALADFHRRWKSDHLVIDKWFSLQAVSCLPSTLTTVKALTRDPLFTIKNPNKVRALVSSFAHGNQLQFNRPDGKGYDFVADVVLELNAINPQVAARLLGAFRSWRNLEAGRRKLARAALRRVAKTRGLSRDVFEIVSKTLEDAVDD